MNKLARLKAMSGDERLLLLQAWLLLPIIALLLRWLGLRRTQRMLIRFAPVHLSGARQTEEALSIARLVNSASRHSFIAASCLPQALALWWLLRREGIESELRIGVRKQQEKFEAHAWVELFGQALNDQAGVEQRFAPFDAAILPPEVRLP